MSGQRSPRLPPPLHTASVSPTMTRVFKHPLKESDSPISPFLPLSYRLHSLVSALLLPIAPHTPTHVSPSFHTTVSL